MADPNQSKKADVGIELPPPSPEQQPNPKTKPPEEVRTHVPVREAAGKTPVPTPIPTPIPAPVAHASDSSDSREETVRVSGVPDSPAAEMRKTQSPIAMPDVTAHNPSIAMAPGKNSMMMIWILFAVSLLILIIQIWTYLS